MALYRQGTYSPLIMHLQCAIDLSNAEIAALESFEASAETVPAGRQLDREGEQHNGAYIVQAGWAMRHKDLSDGRRQILDFVLPGDVLGIEGSVLRRADHSVTALTELQVSRFTFDGLESLLRQQPRLVAALVWQSACQRAVFAEHLVSLGRRSACERVAHLLLEVWRRLKMRGLAPDHAFRMPVTQVILADALGLSVVHMNRSLRQLARDGLVEKNRDCVTIIDLPGLVGIAAFDAGYLNETPMPDETQAALDRFCVTGLIPMRA